MCMCTCTCMCLYVCKCACVSVCVNECICIMVLYGPVWCCSTCSEKSTEDPAAPSVEMKRYRKDVEKR
jgi:hypothetical protein